MDAGRSTMTQSAWRAQYRTWRYVRASRCDTSLRWHALGRRSVTYSDDPDGVPGPTVAHAFV